MSRRSSPRPVPLIAAGRNRWLIWVNAISHLSASRCYAGSGIAKAADLFRSERHEIEVDGPAGVQPFAVPRRGHAGRAGDATGDSDLVRRTGEAILDAAAAGISNRLDRSLCSDGFQLLAALGSGDAVGRPHQGDDLVSDPACAQCAVVAGVLRLARHQNRARHHRCSVCRHCRDDGDGIARRPPRGVAAWRHICSGSRTRPPSTSASSP